jgi:hypothetical protein
MALMRAVIVVLAGLVAGCVGGGGGGVTTVTLPPGASIDTLLNSYRAERGLGRLTKDARLQQAAAAHARDLAAHGRLGHRGSDGSDHVARAERAGYGPFVAENVAAGQKTPAAVMRAWLASSGHRANIVLSPASHYGFAHAVASGGGYKDYWVLVVGRQYDSAPGSGPVVARRGGDWLGSGWNTLAGFIGID